MTYTQLPLLELNYLNDNLFTLLRILLLSFFTLMRTLFMLTRTFSESNVHLGRDCNFTREVLGTDHALNIIVLRRRLFLWV